MLRAINDGSGFSCLDGNQRVNRLAYETLHSHVRHRTRGGWMTETVGGGSNIEATARRKMGWFAWALDVLAAVPFLGLKTLFRFDAAAARMNKGREVLAWWSNELKLNVEVEGQEHIPAEGPILFYGNHPTGIGDGIAIYDALRAAGLDRELAIVMNAQGLEGTPAIADVAVHVGVEKGVRTNNKRQVWRGLQQAVQDKKALVLFPSGKLSQPKWPWSNRFYEGAWRPGVVSIPQKFPALKVVPFRLEARNSRLYYWLNGLFPFLKDLLLYTEFQANRGARYRIRFLPSFVPQVPDEGRAYVMGNEGGGILVD